MTPDPIDRAREQTDAHDAAALRDHAAEMANHETPWEHEGKRLCLDCADPIPTDRLATCPHAVRCVHCQGDHEKRQALFARKR